MTFASNNGVCESSRVKDGKSYEKRKIHNIIMEALPAKTIFLSIYLYRIKRYDRHRVKCDC